MEKRLREIVSLSSRFVEKYRDHPSIEGIVLFGSQVVGAIDEQSDIDLLLVLSDSLLPKIEKAWREGMGDTPVGGLWYEWEILDDKTLPTTQYYEFEGKTIDCLFATLQMIRNSVKNPRPSIYHLIFQEGVIIHDRRDAVKKLSEEAFSSLGDFFENQKKKKYEAFEDLLFNLERFVKAGDLASAEILSVHCVELFVEFMFNMEKKVAPQTSKKTMLDSRKFLEPEIVSQVERVLLSHDLSERLRLLRELHGSLKAKMQKQALI